jgi:hypothetical protein
MAKGKLCVAIAKEDRFVSTEDSNTDVKIAGAKHVILDAIHAA